MALISTQKLPKYSTCAIRGKLTLPQYVVQNLPLVFPPELQNDGKAKLNMFLEVPNDGSRPFEVIASLQKLRKKGGNGVRVILLESGWKLIARELQLKEGDTVKISLLSKKAWTYLIEVERAQGERIHGDAMDEDIAVEAAPIGRQFNLNEPAQLDVGFDLNQPAHE